MAEQRVDVCVVGAGVAGVACAQGLARLGASVVLLDRLHPMPDCLKAEKMSGHEIPFLLRLGFQPVIDAVLTPLHDVAVYFGERHIGTLPLDPPEAGLLYHRFVNSLRDHIDSRVDFRPGTKAVSFEPVSAAGVDVVTGTGEHIPCHIVIMATGDAHHAVEALGGEYEPQAPYGTFSVAFDLEATLSDKRGPVDQQTYHRPVAGGPVAYATFFRLGSGVRANIFCPGEVSGEWQHNLKQQPLAVLRGHNHLIAEITRSWHVVSPVTIRKVHVARLRPPAAERIVVLGDAAHTIDPAGGGGLNFSLLEAELLLDEYLLRWLREDSCSREALQSFYNDPRRLRAVGAFFGAGEYIYALNHDRSAKGRWRRLRFGLRHKLSGRHDLKHTPGTSQGLVWKASGPPLYEQYAGEDTHPDRLQKQ